MKADENLIVWPWDDKKFWAANGDRGQLGYLYSMLHDRGFDVNGLRTNVPDERVIGYAKQLLMVMFRHAVKSKKHLFMTLVGKDGGLLDDVVTLVQVGFSLTFSKSCFSLYTDDFISWFLSFDRDDEDLNSLTQVAINTKLFVWRDVLAKSADRLHKVGSSVSRILDTRRRSQGVTLFVACVGDTAADKIHRNDLKVLAFACLPTTAGSYLVNAQRFDIV